MQCNATFCRIDTRQEHAWRFCEAVCKAAGAKAVDVARVGVVPLWSMPDTSKPFCTAALQI